MKALEARRAATVLRRTDSPVTVRKTVAVSKTDAPNTRPVFTAKRRADAAAVGRPRPVSTAQTEARPAHVASRRAEPSSPPRTLSKQTNAPLPKAPIVHRVDPATQRQQSVRRPANIRMVAGSNPARANRTVPVVPPVKLAAAAMRPSTAAPKHSNDGVQRGGLSRHVVVPFRAASGSTITRSRGASR